MFWVCLQEILPIGSAWKHSRGHPGGHPHQTLKPSDLATFSAKDSDLKEQFESKINVFPLTCIAIHPSWSLGREFLSFESISRADVCPLWNIIDVTQLVVLKVLKEKKIKIIFLSAESHVKKRCYVDPNAKPSQAGLQKETKKDTGSKHSATGTQQRTHMDSLCVHVLSALSLIEKCSSN